MVCGVRVNLDLPARRLHTEWNEHKQSTREEEVYGFTCITTTPLFCCLIWLWVAGYTRNIRNRMHTSLWLGCAQVLWVASWYTAKMECEMFHFPSCSAKSGFRERWKSHYVTCLTWPYKLWKSFVKLGSGLNELQSGFGLVCRGYIFVQT